MELERVRRLEALFADHARAVRAYALCRIDPSTADDIVSEVFVVAFRRLEEIPDEPLPWLLGTARRILANHRRAAGRHEAVTAELTARHASVWCDDIVGGPELLGALAKLSERDRENLLLVSWEDLDGLGGGSIGVLASDVRGSAASSSASARRGAGPQARERHHPTTHGGNEMTDLLQRLRAVNPVPTCDPPRIHDVWSRLEHEDQVSRPATRAPGTPGPKRWRGRIRVFPRPWFWLRHAGLGLAVVVPVLVAALAIVLLGHQNRRSGPTARQPASQARRVHSRPARGAAPSRSMPIDAALARGIRPAAPNVNMALPILGSSGTRSLESFRGKVVVLSVFASWCELCKAQAEALEQAQAHIAEQATVLGVTYEDSPAASEAFVRAAHITYPVLGDPSGRFVRSFGLTGVPETFVIDRLGRIAAARRHQVSARWLEQTLARVLPTSGSAGQVSPIGTRIKSPPTALALAAMAKAYPVLGHRQQSTDIPPYALDFYVLSQGATVANSRRAAVTPQGQSLYIVPAHQSICVVSSDNVTQGCQPFPLTATTPATIGATICAPNLPSTELEVAGLMPPDASDIKAHYSNGSPLYGQVYGQDVTQCAVGGR